MTYDSDARSGLKKILIDKNLPVERFAINDDREHKVYVRLTDTWFSFYVNIDDPFSDNEEYLCGRYPYPKSQPYRTKVNRWPEVVEEFLSWINSIEPYLFTKIKGEKHLTIKLPRHELPAFEQNLLAHLYKEFQVGGDIDPIYRVIARLYPNPPSGFNYNTILTALERYNLIRMPNHITGYGIWYVEANSEILDLIDEVINYVKNRIGTEIKLAKITALEVQVLFNLTPLKVQLVFRILRDLGGFMKEIKGYDFQKIDIDDEKIYSRYLSYTDLQNLLVESINSKVEDEATHNINLLETVTPILQKTILEINSFIIKDVNEIDPVLGVKDLAKQVVEIIHNLKSEPGSMVGVFGPWGRGKTYLINRITNLLLSEKKNYQLVKFHAWRYQDTPASWAYLYERFSEEYLGDKRQGLIAWVKYQFRLWVLNLEREGIWKSIYLAMGFFMLSIFYVAIKPNDIFLNLIALFGFPLAALLINFIIENLNREYLSKAVNLIKKYGIKTSFRDNLGIQAEIQKELVHLVNAWTKSKKLNRIVLFVDDLDRCKEEKSLEIIDSLRIILDEEKIFNKLLVITAVDQRILKTAVSNRYCNLPQNSEQVREYIDKLFIFSLKLNALSHDESKEFFDTLIKNDKEVLEEAIKKKEEENVLSNAASLIETIGENFENEEEIKSTRVAPNISTTAIKTQKLTEFEIDRIKNRLISVSNPTPRKIRILYYRYRFAKNILIQKYSRNKDNPFWLIEPNLDHFLSLLIYLSQASELEFTTEINRINIIESNEVDSKLILGFKCPKHEYLNLFRILQLVIAY